MRCGMRIGTALIAVGLFHGAAAAADEFRHMFTLNSDGQIVRVVDEPLPHGDLLKTRGDYWIIHVTRVVGEGESPEDYYILFGPDPTPTTTSAGLGIIRPSTDNPAHQELAVSDGIAYIIGLGLQRPYGGTDGGSGVGEGTIFIVQGRSGTATDRFIFLDTHGASGAHVRVFKKNVKAQERQILEINQYLEIPNTGNMSGITAQPLRNEIGIRDMVWRVVKLADMAGLDRPLPF